MSTNLDIPAGDVFGDAIHDLQGVKTLNDNLMDLINHASELLEMGVNVNRELLKFKLFTLWKATKAMREDTRTLIFEKARENIASYLRHSNSLAALSAKHLLDEMIYYKIFEKDFDFRYIQDSIGSTKTYN